MAGTIASKNLYELLGNDPELDPDREPEPPTKAIDKPVARTGKRNAGAEGPAGGAGASAGGRGGRQDVQRRADLTGDRPANNNRADQRDDGLRQDRHPDRLRGPREHRGGEIDGRGRGSGGRGSRGRGRADYRGTRTARDDRHNHSGIGEHEKQAAHGWGENTGAGELADEQAGEQIAKAEGDNTGDVRDPAISNGPDGVTGEDDAAPAQEEDKTKSYEQYLAELAEKRLALNAGPQEIRKPNEGSKAKFPEGTAFSRNPEEENFFAGAGGKAKKTRERTEKERLELDGQYYAPVEQPDRGGARGGRGGRGGSRGEGGRGRGEGRGGRGGGRGRGLDGGFRGAPSARGGSAAGGRGGNLNPTDESAFPALGGK